MATFLKGKTRKNGFTAYRQANSRVSFLVPSTAFPQGLPDTIEIDGDGLSAGSTGGGRGPVAKDPAVQAALQVIADAKAARKAALAAKLAGMTPEQIAKRDERLAKLKAKVAAKKAQANL